MRCSVSLCFVLSDEFSGLSRDIPKGMFRYIDVEIHVDVEKANTERNLHIMGQLENT